MTIHVNDGLGPDDAELEVVRIEIELEEDKHATAPDPDGSDVEEPEDEADDSPVEELEDDEPVDESTEPVDEEPVDDAAATNGGVRLNGLAVAALATSLAGRAVEAAEISDDAPCETGPDSIPTPAPSTAQSEAPRSFSLPDLRPLIAAPLAALLVLSVVGFLIGRSRGDEQIVRREFVYTLNQSVPDSFLREDRRLLTQIATLESDAVLTPVAATFDRTVEDLRDAIKVETVDLSEVLRLEVRDRDRDTALAIGDAVFAQYVEVTSTPLPTETSDALRAQREIIVADLATADADLLAVRQTRRADAALLTQEESLGRQIQLREEQVNRLQGLLDTSLTSELSATRRSNLLNELSTAEGELAEYESQLATVRTDRAQLAEQSATEPPLTREIERLETELETIDAELAQRELGPLVSSPVRTLSEPTVKVRSANRAGLDGTAAGLLIGLPIAALLGYRARKRELWFD